MKWVLSPAGITTYADQEKVNYKFYTKILNDNGIRSADTLFSPAYECTIDSVKNSEYYRTLSLIKHGGYILFDGSDRLSNLIDDRSDVILPINNEMNYYMSVYQLRFLKNNINNLTIRQQFFINSFLLTTKITPISEIFVENKCLECIYENHTNNKNYIDVIKHTIITKCENCCMLKYKNRIKLMNEFVDHVEEKNNVKKLFEYMFNENNLIIGNKTVNFYLDSSVEWYDDMIKLNYITIKNSLSES